MGETGECQGEPIGSEVVVGAVMQTTAVRLSLGLTGSLWLNLTQHGKTYQVQT
jgi:hypothetical protein